MGVRGHLHIRNALPPWKALPLDIKLYTLHIYIYIYTHTYKNPTTSLDTEEMSNALLSLGIKPLTMTSRPQLMLTQATSNSSVPTSLNAQTVFIIGIKCLFLFKEKAIVITVGNLQTTSIQCASKTQSYFTSHRNTHTEALCSQRCSKTKREHILITLRRQSMACNRGNCDRYS